MSTYTNSYALRDLTALTRALSDANRVRVLIALREKELCVCQLVELLGLAPSTVSRHLAILSQCYLLDSRRAGRWVYYRRAGGEAPPAVRNALDWIDTAMKDASEVARDHRRLEEILARPLHDLCGPDAPEVER